MNGPDRHLTDEDIVRWVDEGDPPRDVRATEHLDRCEACRGRIAGVEALVAELGAEPPAMTGVEMAAQRDRILAAVRSRPRVPVRRLSRRSVWLPAIAAAAIAGLLLWAPRGTRSPGPEPTPDAPVAHSATLPVIVDATRAAEEMVEAAGEPGVVEALVESSSTDITPPDVAAPTLDEWSGSAELEREFAELPSEDREAILTELASVDFINDSQE
jgi:anti-sigma factor RsiW